MATLNADDAEWQRRCAKRSRAILDVKASQLYRNAPSPRPTTPDPTDRALSKRAWEYAVVRYRRLLHDSPETSSQWLPSPLVKRIERRLSRALQEAEWPSPALQGVEQSDAGTTRER